MTAGLRKYPAYRDSHQPWLESVPAHWALRRLRTVAEMRVSSVDKVTAKEDIAVRLCNYVDVYNNQRISDRIEFMRASATQDQVARFRLRKGDVLITKDSESWNDIGVPSLVEYEAEDLVCGYHLALLRPRADLVRGEYLFRALQSKDVAVQLHVSANGVTRYGLAHGAIRSVVLPLPPMHEQVAIVRYLDHVDRRIGRFIRAKRKLVRLLEEQKQTAVQRAATRGLDPDAPLKASGLDWLGDVPEHWKVRRNGQLFAQRNETGFESLPLLEVSLRTGVRLRSQQVGRQKRVSLDRSTYKRAAAGDVVYNMMRAWQGAIGMAPEEGLVSSAYVVARPLTGPDSRYFGSLFKTPLYVSEMARYSRGIAEFRNRLYWEDFKRMYSCCPPRDEQIAIADAIDATRAAIESEIQGVRRQIELVSQYRVRIIADVVTGRLDVRDASAELPDEEEQSGSPSDATVFGAEDESEEGEEASLAEVEA